MIDSRRNMRSSDVFAHRVELVSQALQAISHLFSRGS